MQQVIQTGVFTQASADIINGNFNALAGILGPGKLIYVNANGGSDSLPGDSWDNALHTMAEAFRLVASGDVILFCGQVKEQLVAPLGVSNVRIIGAATRPRYGNEGSFAQPLNDRAAAWRPPAVPTAATPLLILRQQGWVLDNVLFDCPVDAAAVKLWRNEDAVHPDPSSATIQNCQFSDGQDGIEDVGGCYNILIQNNSFRRLTGHSIFSSSQAIALPLDWVIQNNIFEDVAGGITAPFSNATIQNNLFINGVTNTYANGKIITTAGVRNFVINNYTYDVAANINPAGGYAGVATDVWRTFASATAAAVVVSPPA